jgi:hypothetical protein
LISLKKNNQVVGHQVDRALGAREGAADQPREGAQQRGLADADVALQQHMATREHGGVDPPDHLGLADHDLRDQALDVQGAATPVGQQRVLSVHGRRRREDQGFMLDRSRRQRQPGGSPGGVPSRYSTPSRPGLRSPARWSS